MIMMKAERIEQFLGSLRQADAFSVGVDQVLRVQALLVRLAAEGRLPESLQALARLIGPIVCRSGREQDLFRERFDQWFAKPDEAETPTPVPVVALPPAEQDHAAQLKAEIEQERESRDRWRKAGWIAGVLALLVVIVGIGTQLAVPRQQPVDPLITEPGVTAPNGLDVGFSLDQVAVARFAAAGLPLVVLFGVLAWRRSRFSVLARDFTTRAPHGHAVVLDTAWRSLFSGRAFQSGLRWLRAYRQVGSGTADIRRTLDAQVRNGYVADLYFSTRPQKPGHLVLVARESPRDHQTALAAVLTEKLRQANVEVLRFDFFRQPLRLRAVRRDGTLRPAVTPLPQLAVSHHHDRLVILGEGAGFVHPLTRQPRTWLKPLEAWEERYLLSPIDPADWGWREQRLKDLGFVVAPATSKALSVLGTGRDSHRFARRPAAGDDGIGLGPYPSSLLRGEGRWLENLPPGPGGVDTLVAELEDWLGPRGFDWLCACAVFPELHPEITLHLGMVLARQGERLFSEPRLLALTRLPWFRTGAMPLWLRLALIACLPAELDEDIRVALHGVLVTGRPGRGGPLTLDIARRDPGIAVRLLEKLALDAPAGSPLREQVFLDFMRGHRPPQGAVLGTRELESVLRPRRLPSRGLMLWTLASFASALGLWWYLPQLTLPVPQLTRVSVDASHLALTAMVLAAAAPLALLATVISTLWGRWGMSDRLRRNVDAMLLLAVLAGTAMGLLTETPGTSEGLAPTDRVLLATTACLLVLGLRRCLGSYRVLEIDTPSTPVAVLRRPEQWTLMGNLVVAIALTMAFATGVYELLGGKGGVDKPGTLSDLFAAVGLWGALWTVVPWGGALVALKTALGLRWVPIGLLALAVLIGAIAGGLSMVASYGDYPNFREDFSTVLGTFVAGHLFLALAAHRLGTVSTGTLRRMASQLTVTWISGLPASAWVWSETLDNPFDWASLSGVSLFVTPPAVALAALDVPNRFQWWAGRRVSSPMLTKGRAVVSLGAVVGLLVYLCASIVRQYGFGPDYTKFATYITFAVTPTWLIAAAVERLAMRREGLAPLALTRDTRSPPLALAILALACSFEFPSGLIPILGGGLDPSACLIPLGAWLGHRYGRRGLYVLAASALPVLLGLLSHDIRSAGDQGLYFVALIVCRLSDDTELLKRYLVASILTPAHIALLFLGLTAAIFFSTTVGVFRLSLATLYYFSFFALGLSAVNRHTRVRTFALILAGFFVLRLIGAQSAGNLAVLGAGDLDSIIYVLLAYHLGRMLRLALLCGGRPERLLCAATGRVERLTWLFAVLGLVSAVLALRWTVGPRDAFSPAATLTLFPPILIGLAWGFLAFMAASRRRLLATIAAKFIPFLLQGSAPPAYVRSLRPMLLLGPRRLALCAVLVAFLFYGGLAPAPADGLRFALGVFDFEATLRHPITAYLTLAVFFYFGARLGKAGLPDLSSLPRYRARPATRPIPHLDLGWLGRLLTVWGALAMALGLLAAGVDWVEFLNSSGISEERQMK